MLLNLLDFFFPNIVRRIQKDILFQACSELKKQAGAQFDKKGPQDARGAAFWDASCHLDPWDGDFFKLGKRSE